MNLMDLNGIWKMRKVGDIHWINASVPGSVYHDLLSAGKMADPYYRDNEASSYELSNFSYEYQKEFIISEDMLRYDNLALKCEGLDTLAEIFLNNKKVASTENMHKTYEFNIKKLLLVGENILKIVFKSPIEYLNTRKKEKPIWSNFSDTSFAYLRKAHYMFGWDWAPSLPDMGIWRNISINGWNKQRLDDIYVTQNHNTGKVSLDVRVRLESEDGSPNNVSVSVSSPDGFKTVRTITMNKKEEYLVLDIDEPRLWWPRGYGEQNLYNVEVVLKDEEEILDSSSFRIGLRTMTVITSEDQWGTSFAFCVNGIEIFAMGANFVPMDNILARCTRERTEKLIKSCAEANFNCIRVWGGGYYPEDYFFDLCDEYGLIVWQDLMFACGVYDFFDRFKEEVIDEVKQNIRRIRHHASLGLWCGNNEMELGWAEWDMGEGEERKQYYIDQFETVLPQVAKETDPNTFYWRASPSSIGSFDRPNDENHGDMHDWTVWHGREPFTEFRKRFPRFMSEFGLQSFPCMKTIESFTLKEDRNIFSHVMENHQKSGTGNEKIMYYISQYFKYPKNFDSLLYVSQLIQAEGIRYGVEHWRRNRGRCMGAIYWQLNDCWPVASWSSIDSFGRWKALHYAAKRFYSNILVSACEAGSQVSLHVTNDTLKDVSGTLKWRLLTEGSDEISEGSSEITINPLSAIECEKLDFKDVLDSEHKKQRYYLEFRFFAGNQTVSSGTVLFVPPKHFNFSDPMLETSVLEESDRFVISVKAKNFAKYIELGLKTSDGLFSDNFFDLNGMEEKEVDITKDSLSNNLTLDEFREQLSIRSLFDSY